MIASYVYKIINNHTGEFYIGSRYQNVKFNRSPEEDLLVHYCTSGKLSKNIKENVSDYIGLVLFNMNDNDVVFWYEQLLIKENIKNPLCKNENYIDPDKNIKVFSSTGVKRSESTKQKMRKPKSEAHKRNMSAARTGTTRTQETKDKLSKFHMGLKASAETRKKMSDTRKGIPQHPNTRIALAKVHNGRKNTESSKERMSLAAKNKPKVMCPYCVKMGNISIMKRWHFDNCKRKNK